MTTPPAYPVYPVDAIAKLLNLTPRRIRQLVAEGIIPRVERGKYDLIRSVRGYVKYLQERAEGRGVEPSGLHEERMRLLTAQAEHKELEVAALHRSLLPFDEVVAAWEQLTAAFRARCLTIPSKLAPRLAVIHERKEIHDILTAQVRATLTELARYELSEGGDTAGGANGKSRGQRRAPIQISRTVIPSLSWSHSLTIVRWHQLVAVNGGRSQQSRTGS